MQGPPHRYPQVEKVIQVEIDEAVPEVAQEFLPEIAAGYQAVDSHQNPLLDKMKNEHSES